MILHFLPFILIAFVLAACQSKKEESSDNKKATSSVKDKQIDTISIAFVKNETCVECHPVQFKEWTGSHHDLAMQEATDLTVRGNFNNVSLKLQVEGNTLCVRYPQTKPDSRFKTLKPNMIDGPPALYRCQYTQYIPNVLMGI